MILGLTLNKMKEAGFSIKEAFSIRKITKGMTPAQVFGELEMLLNDTKDKRYFVLMNLLVEKIRV